MTPLRIGILGTGHVSSFYVKNLLRIGLPIVALADLLPAKAESKLQDLSTLAQTQWHLPLHPLPRLCSVDALLAAPDVDLILNLTPPSAHVALTLRALSSGKHVYSEKPLATSRADARRILDLAAQKNLRVASAPDTFLAPPLQTARRLLDSGAIGTPLAAAAFLAHRGHEHWHPNPAPFYQPGGGPLFDAGPYFLAALVSLLGPIRRATAMAQISFPQRTIPTTAPSPALRGTTLPISTPTHIAGALQFASGPIASLLFSFDLHHHSLPRLEIYGTHGTLTLPDPIAYSGHVRIARPGETAFTDVPLLSLPSPLAHIPTDFARADSPRGLGLADLADSLAENRPPRPPRASADLAFHVLDTLETLLESAAAARTLDIHSTTARPEPLAAPSS